MLEDLPIEILQQVSGHLPTASAIVYLSLTNKRLHGRLSVDDYTIFRQFVQNRFPSISCPPFWKESACILTARSRAWDRKALIASVCQPPPDDQFWTTRLLDARQKFGFVPVIDSYEAWNTGTNRREVLAWGAAGRLRLRVTEHGTSWRTWRMPDDHLPQNDILDVHLLRPHQRPMETNEQIVVRRANRQVVKVEAGIAGGDILPESRFPSDQFLLTTKYATDGNFVDCMHVNNAAEPILAICNTKTIQLFNVNSNEAVTPPSNTYLLEQKFGYKHRKRCASFLSDEKLALGVQFLEGRMPSPIDVYHVTPHGLVQDSSTAICSLRVAEDHHLGRQCANVIAPLDATASLAGRPGDVFLSGWSDGTARLHDLRRPLTSVLEYVDGVDDGQILSLLPIGHEKFLAGSHHNACLKTYDLRMPGARAYSYLDAVTPHGEMPPSTRIVHAGDSSTEAAGKGPSRSPRDTDINIFLSLHIPPARRLWQPLPRRPDSRLPRYRGSIYSLSAPSPSSPTVFAGIENHVIQVDFKSTDDVAGSRRKFFDTGTNSPNADQILNLSCYERPRPGHESTDPVLLRKQVDLASRKKVHTTSFDANNNRDGKAEPGWDERWRLATYDRQSGRRPGWRANS